MTSCPYAALSGLPDNVSNAVSWLGLFFVALFAWKVLSLVLGALWKFFLRPAKNLRKLGDWAVVTGCTDGIGRGYAKELARKGLNIVLISRSKDKLEDTAQEIKSKYSNVETKIIVADFSKADKALFNKIRSECAGLKVAVLVNNVGVSYPYPQYFHELSEDSLNALLEINVRATTEVTRIFLPDMEQRKKGAIVNVTSAAGEVPQGLLAIYSASKSYISSFSRSLSQEYRDRGIHVQLVVPMFVTSKLSKIRKTSLMVPSADRFARDAVATIGHDEVTVPYWPHALQLFASDVLPARLTQAYTFDMHKSIRRRALKKLEEKAKSQ